MRESPEMVGGANGTKYRKASISVRDTRILVKVVLLRVGYRLNTGHEPYGYHCQGSR